MQYSIARIPDHVDHRYGLIAVSDRNRPGTLIGVIPES
jgi:hypothetical protein